MSNALSKAGAILLSISLMVTSAACGSKQNSIGLNGEGTVTTVKQEPKVTYEVMYSGIIAGFPDDGGEGRKLIAEGAAKAGITDFDLHISFAAASEYFNKLGVMAAAQELPDFFEVNPVNMRKFSEAGYLMELDEYIKNMPNYIKYHPKDAESGVMLNGKTYAFSSCIKPAPFNGNSMTGLVIRQDWLDNVGLKVPETLDQMYEVMKAFVEKDPDGNGQKDTYGIGITKGGAGRGVLSNVIGAFGISPLAWTERNGRLIKGCVLPEMKSALSVLQKWYTEGLIEKDMLSISAKDLNNKFAGSKYGIYDTNAFFMNSTNELQKTLKQSTPSAKVLMMEAPKGPEGKRGIFGGNPASGIMAMSATTKAPVRLTKYIDWILDDGPNGGFHLVTYGVEGTHYTYDSKADRITKIASDPDLIKFGLGNPARITALSDRRWLEPEALAAATTTNKYIIESKYNGSVPAEVDYTGDLNKLFDDYFYKIMTGKLPVTAWDDFVKQWYDQGGKEIENQVNEEYNKMKK